VDISSQPQHSLWAPHPDPGPLSLLGSCFLAAGEEAPVRHRCGELAVVQWETEAQLLGWVLTSAWDAGRLLLPALAAYMPLAVEEIPALLEAEAGAILASLEPHDQAELLTWTRFALRGYGADGIEAGSTLVVLGSSSALRPVTSIPLPPELLAPPSATRKAQPPSKRKNRPKPRVHTLRGAPLRQDSLLRALGLHIRPAEGEASFHHVGTVATLRNQVLEEAVEMGLLTSAQAYMPLSRLGITATEGGWVESLLAAAPGLEWHPRVAVSLCSHFRSRLRASGAEGIEFADGTVLVFPHYALRGLSKDPLWRELCSA